MIKRALIALLMLLPLPATATPLIADLSQYRIDMDSSFNGTRLFLFGARNETGDVVIVVRGPLKDYIVRKKEEIAGIWVNRDRMKFRDVPDFYVVASNKILSDINQKALFTQLGIGHDTLLVPPSDHEARLRFSEFSTAFFEHQYDKRLYTSDPTALQFMGETLFKTTVEFPDNIPPGNYTAEIYLISGGEVVGMQSTPIKVRKTGLDAFLFNYAHNSPALYGITAIVLALAAGWFAGRLFEKT